MGNGNWERKEKSEDWATHFPATIIGNPAYSYSNSQLGNLFASPRNVELAAPYYHGTQTHSSTQHRLHGSYLQPLYAYILLGNSHPLHHTLGAVNDIINEGRERNATTRVLPTAPGQ